MVVTIGMMAAGSASTLVAPPSIVAQDIRSSYRSYTLADAVSGKDGMADNPALEAAIRDLADEVKKLREEKPKKTPGELFATWSPIVALAVFALTAFGSNTRVADLEKKVDKGFSDVTAALHSLDLRLTRDEIVAPASAASAPSDASRRTTPAK